MIIFLNGPFSVGKTTTARILVERIPQALLYDPEFIGGFLRQHILADVEQPDDFQDIPFWPRLTVELAGMVIESYRRNLVIPMTLWQRERALSMRAAFSALDPDLLWLQLTAPREILEQRILARDDVPGGDRSWWFDHLESGLAMASDPAFGIPVATENRTPTEVADAITERFGRHWGAT